MNFPDGWVELTQLRKALRTAVGSPKRVSKRMATANASGLLAGVDINGARRGRKAFRAEVASQIYRGTVDRGSLDRVVRDLFEPGDLAVVRGPEGAQLSVDAIVSGLDATLTGYAMYETVKDQQFDRLRTRHQVIRRQYELDRPALAAAATPDLAHMFAEGSVTQQVERAPGLLLQMLGMGVHREFSNGGTS